MRTANTGLMLTAHLVLLQTSPKEAHGHQLVRSFTQESLPLKLCLITSSQPDITTTKALL